MFTGIVAGLGEIVATDDGASGRRIRIRSDILGACEIGASVAIDGVCLTVVARDQGVCDFDVSRETVVRSALGRKNVGERVNLETPLRAGDEFGGHIVQGHVDEVGTVASVTGEEGGRRLRIRVRPESTRYVVEKGSVTLDGVSLTVTDVDDASFEVALIPHTLAVTTLGEVTVGRELNVEVDVIAKYVERLTGAWHPKP
jgi:riboflavin synthase